MNRNIWIILISSALFNVCLGMYDFALPYFFDSINISYAKMGMIFGISSGLIFFLRMYVGAHSDRIGRKPFYSIGLLLSSLSILATPLFPGLIAQASFKTIREASLIVRDTMRSILVFENTKKDFHKIISKIIGIEFFLQGAGTLISGIIMTGGMLSAGFLAKEVKISPEQASLPLYVCGAILLLAFIFFYSQFKENFKGNGSKAALGFKDLVRINLPPKLLLLTATMFIFNLGVSISHSFFMPLFFKNKFLLGAAVVAVILMIHRFTLGLPMFVFGNFIKRKDFKKVYILSMIYEGLAIGAAALIPNFWIATCLWLTHDFFGAAFWSPINTSFIQEFARPESRGRDTSEAAALGSLGAILGPIIAGWLAGISVDLPFLVSGIVTALSIVPMFWL